MRYTPEEAAQLDVYLRSGDTAAAFKLYQSRYPPKGLRSFPDMDEGVILNFLTLRPPTLGFLSWGEMREIQVASATIMCGGSRWSPQNYFRPGFVWKQQMLPRAAFQHMSCYASWVGEVASWKKYPLTRVIRITHSSNPCVCAACTEAGRYLYSQESVPSFPIAGCTNLADGCRCAWNTYALNKNSPSIDDLLKQHNLKPKWDERPEPINLTIRKVVRD